MHTVCTVIDVTTAPLKKLKIYSTIYIHVHSLAKIISGAVITLNTVVYNNYYLVLISLSIVTLHTHTHTRPHNTTHTQSIEFFFFAILIFAVTIIFAIMSFFYKYVDPAQIAQSDQSDEDASGGGGGSDESSALILDKSVGAESEQTIPSGGSDLDLDFGTTSEF